MAEEVAQVLMAEPFNKKIDGFLVSEHEGNPDSVLGMPVLSLDELRLKEPANVPIVIASMDKHLDSIERSLHKHGFVNYLPLTFESDEWAYCQGRYVEEYCRMKGEPFDLFNEPSQNIEARGGSAHIYSVKSIYDKELAEITAHPWEIPIQVGKALTDKRIADITDDTGDNISAKNRQYCELTALYWIWKNDTAEYKGMGHYRRHFCLSEDTVNRLYACGADMIVTTPVVNFPNVKAVYYHDHSEDDWKILEEAVNKLRPEYSISLKELGKSRYYYAYNMFIAKRKVFDNYCSFLFPLLSYCEENCGLHGDAYQERFIGFLAERLLRTYIIKNQDNIRTAVISKHFSR